MDHRITEILTTIEASFTQAPDVDALAEMSNVSISHLQHLFKEETGKSITQHVKQLRLEKACSLLQTTNLRIKEICYSVGMADCSHFVRDFKREFGVSPSEYRNSVITDSRIR
ncbi:MAG: AraC family transcriptional regulator [Pyrinomonadaceae bacterium]